MLNRLIAPAVLVLTLTACGGGGGGGGNEGPITGPVSAGANQSVPTSTRVYLVPTSTADSGTVNFVWDQTAGAPVTVVLSTVGPVFSSFFTAPANADVLEFELSGLNAAGDVVGTDRIIITVEAEREELQAAGLSTISIRGGGEGRATASALHAASERLFVIDSVAGDVVCYDVSNPSNPSFAGALPRPDDAPGFQVGMPTAIAAGETGAVAIAWTGETIEFPGRLQFIDPLTLQELNSISVAGANPVDVDVTPDGRLFAVACAGDFVSAAQGNGPGYVTLVRVPVSGPGAIASHQDISPIPFTAFDGSEDDLRAKGVRFFSPVAQASIGLTPRSVAISPDGTTVWASCPENNALITIDPVEKLVRGIEALPDRTNGDRTQGTHAALGRFTWETSPVIATGPGGLEVQAGGIAGIFLPNGSGMFRYVTGSGPTLAPVDLNGDQVLELPYVDPTAQLRIEESVFDGAGAALTPFTSVPLVSATGEPLTGLPASYASQPGLATNDGRAVDLLGNPLAASVTGVRLEGATQALGGSIWLADSRRCSIIEVSPAGQVIRVLVPEGESPTLGQPGLPGSFLRRRANLSFEEGRRFGGFGAIAYHAGRNSIFACPRLPLDIPDTTTDLASRSSRILRVLEFSLDSNTAVGEYVYVLEALNHAVEGMAAGNAPIFAGGLGVVEAAFESDGLRAIFALDITDATNLQLLSATAYAQVNAFLEASAPEDLDQLAVPITPIAKRLVADLGEAGLASSARPSGLVMVGLDEVIVSFNDGFRGLVNAPLSGGVGASGTVPSFFARGHFEGMRFDTAVDGLEAPLAGGVPAVALPQPLDLAGFDTGAGPRVALANGGLPFTFTNAMGGPGYDERLRAADQILDTNVFPGASLWQRDPFGGDLIISERDSDLNDDGLVDRLAIFGSRSIGLANGAGQMTWTSPGTYVSRARVLRPDMVDAAATTFGIRPVALARGRIGGASILATAMEGAGLVSVHAMDNVDAPLLLGFTGAGVRPVDVDLMQPSGGSTILAITDEESGTVILRLLTLAQ